MEYFEKTWISKYFENLANFNEIPFWLRRNGYVEMKNGYYITVLPHKPSLDNIVKFIREEEYDENI